MATTRPFAYNTGTTINGTTQVGNLAVGVSAQNYSANPGSVKWWMGPDESLGYVIAKSIPSNTQSTPVGVNASVGFERSTSLTDNSFISLANTITNQGFTGATQASTWLTANGYWNSYPNSTPAGTIYTAATLSNVTTVAQSPFTGGGNSYSLNGSTSKISLAADSSWAVGTGDFTIEWFQYQTDSSSYPRIFAIGSYPSTSIGCSIEGGTFYAWCSSALSYGTVNVKNAWHHFAIVRRSSNLYVYLNGTQISTSRANTTNITNSSTTLYLGVENNGNSGTFYGGYLTNFRWVKGLAVYTGNFTKPTGALTLTASANPFGGSNTVAIPEGYTKLLLVP